MTQTEKLIQEAQVRTGSLWKEKEAPGRTIKIIDVIVHPDGLNAAVYRDTESGLLGAASTERIARTCERCDK